MSLPIELRGEAQVEFSEAFDWYHAKPIGLGLEFLLKSNARSIE